MIDVLASSYENEVANIRHSCVVQARVVQKRRKEEQRGLLLVIALNVLRQFNTLLKVYGPKLVVLNDVESILQSKCDRFAPCLILLVLVISVYGLFV